jgi:hypothetical protein
MKIEFSTSFSKNPQKLNFLKILQVRAELLHAKGVMDRHVEANSRFLQFRKWGPSDDNLG